jgi:hypothetical protein
MFQSLSNSWELAKASWSVLSADKELLIFPLISMIGVVIVLITFAIPFSVLLGVFSGMTNEQASSDASSVLLFVFGFLFYVVMYFVIFFCNTALVGAALIRLRGGDPTLGDGFRIASERLGKIFGFAVVSATVGMILQIISERGGWIGEIVVSIIGFIWTVATYLVVPILVLENVGPIDAVKRSVELLKRTWGENLVANLTIGALFGWIIFAVFIVFGGLIAWAASIENMVLAVSFGVALVLVWAIISLISSALTGIYQAALYLYATDGQTAAFDASVLQGAFKRKNG